MSVKIHLDYFPDNCEDYSEEQGENTPRPTPDGRKVPRI